MPNILNNNRAFMKDGIIKAAVLAGVDEASRRWMEHEAKTRGDIPVIVVNYHSVPKSAAVAFRRQLVWVKSRFEVTDFGEFDRMFTSPGTIESGGRARVLLTFDDGYRDNLEVAAPVMEELGLRGLFFVVPGFHQNGLYLSAEGIGNLHHRGHTVGCHTMNHAGLDETPLQALQDEIVASGKKIEDWIGAEVNTFAWTYAWNRIRPDAWQLIRDNYRYCFTPCPGIVQPKKTNPHMLWRTNVEADYSSVHYRFMFSGLPGLIWAKKRSELYGFFRKTRKSAMNEKQE